MIARKNMVRMAVAIAAPILVAAYYTMTMPGSGPAIAATQHQNTTQGTVAVQQLPNFTQIVEQNGASVVNVSVTKKSPAGAQPQMPGVPEGDPLNEFFRRFAPPQQQGEQPMQRGQGSGFIVSADGIILTNAHVAADATEITVKLTDKREFDAKVLGVDRRTDIAVLKIDAKDLPIVRIGDAEHLKVGEWVAAIGSPFGFENTVTSGIVSAKARSLPDENYVPFIQTDVAVNPGNSGGPLFNMNGEVIGINSQIFSRTGGYMGLSFAIPIDVAMKIKDELVQHGKV
ncbi:MAG: trypsin-like peptidase domain-containing protein, partial [Deltaproteobacteria bacterium]|nr:trypsin-like peptidase domain-containing protein [Deltaproteobacteria bacterium]